MQIFREKEGKYFRNEYGMIGYYSKSMSSFLNEIFEVIEANITLSRNMSFLDIGCGRGYFLKYLASRGYNNIKGIDPCSDLIENKLYSEVNYGSFEDNNFNDSEFDIVFTCHTLHHLRERTPIHAVREMIRISQKYIIVIEINNWNVAMFLRSLWKRDVERNGFTYNIDKVKKMVRNTGVSIVYANNLNAMYISGDSLLHRVCYKIGTKPYNIVIVRKDQI